MDIAAISMSTAQKELYCGLGISMVRKNLDQMETVGADMVKMMEQSVTPHLGKNLDVSV